MSGIILVGLACCVLAALFVMIAVIAFHFYKKSLISTGLSIQCSSGDSEVMSFNHNFLHGESNESKASKIFESFQMIQDRRDENHQKFLKIREDAIKENELKNPEDLKLRSITQ